MQLLISDASELQLPARAAEIQQFFAAIGYQIVVKDEQLMLSSAYGTWQLTTPLTAVRDDCDHFLSLKSDQEALNLPYLSQGATWRRLK